MEPAYPSGHFLGHINTHSSSEFPVVQPVGVNSKLKYLDYFRFIGHIGRFWVPQIRLISMD